jgi:hypothetical protein
VDDSVLGGHRRPTGAAAAIGDTRNVISAEAAYQSANSGFYGTLSCLATPSRCIPNYTGPTFLDESLAGAASQTKQGYDRTWTQHASTSGPPGSVDAFCYGSTPAASNKLGVRSFGGDSTGVIGATDRTAACCDDRGNLNLATCPPLK